MRYTANLSLQIRATRILVMGTRLHVGGDTVPVISTECVNVENRFMSITDSKKLIINDFELLALSSGKMSVFAIVSGHFISLSANH